MKKYMAIIESWHASCYYIKVEIGIFMFKHFVKRFKSLCEEYEE